MHCTSVHFMLVDLLKIHTVDLFIHLLKNSHFNISKRILTGVIKHHYILYTAHSIFQQAFVGQMKGGLRDIEPESESEEEYEEEEEVATTTNKARYG